MGVAESTLSVELLSREQAAEYLQISVRKLDGMRSIPPGGVGPAPEQIGSRVFYSKAELAKYKTAREMRKAPPGYCKQPYEMPDELVAFRDAAKILGVAPRTLRYRRSKQIPPIPCIRQGKLYYRMQDLYQEIEFKAWAALDWCS